MTAVRMYHLRCDGFRENRARCLFQVGDVSNDPRDPYPNVDRYGGRTVAEERQRAAHDGWSRDGKKDYCPPCTERRKATS